jgi:hypothetical protein
MAASQPAMCGHCRWKICEGSVGKAWVLGCCRLEIRDDRKCTRCAHLGGRGEAPLGIVYATDAKVDPKVKIIGTFPADSYPTIVYPVAATMTAKPEADTYLSYLRSASAKAVFEQYGFVFLIPPGSQFHNFRGRANVMAVREAKQGDG